MVRNLQLEPVEYNLKKLKIELNTEPKDIYNSRESFNLLDKSISMDNLSSNHNQVINNS